MRIFEKLNGSVLRIFAFVLITASAMTAVSCGGEDDPYLPGGGNPSQVVNAPFLGQWFLTQIDGTAMETGSRPVVYFESSAQPVLGTGWYTVPGSDEQNEFAWAVVSGDEVIIAGATYNYSVMGSSPKQLVLTSASGTRYLFLQP